MDCWGKGKGYTIEAKINMKEGVMRLTTDYSF